MGAIFPENLGGAGFGYIEYSIIIEELARVDPSVALIVAAHNSLCTNHIYLAGNEDQRLYFCRPSNNLGIQLVSARNYLSCFSFHNLLYNI